MGQVPFEDLDSLEGEAYYLPMHAVYKEDSTISKLWIVFVVFARMSSGNSLNDHLLVGPTVHPPLVNVLLRFRKFSIPRT